MSILPTVRILHTELEGGVIINASDLTDEMVLHDPKLEKQRRSSDKKAAAAAAQAEVDEAAERVESAQAALAAIKDKTEQGAQL